MLHLISQALAATIAAASLGTARPAEQVVVIHAKDYAFEAPKTVKANGPITFRLVNDGKEMHHVSIMKLAAGKTMKDLAAALQKPGPFPTWLTAVGGPNPALPGGSVDAVLNLEPGNYALLCFINSPGNPMPHMAKGMVGSITIEAGAAGVQQAGMPSADVTFRTSEYKFAAAKSLAAGKHMINVINDGVQPHEVVLVELAPGKTAQDVSNWVDRDMMKGPPPGRPIGGIAALDHGRTGSFPVDLKAGKYAVICFVPDSKDGKAHSAHGMLQAIDVK